MPVNSLSFPLPVTPGNCVVEQGGRPILFPKPMLCLALSAEATALCPWLKIGSLETLPVHLQSLRASRLINEMIKCSNPEEQADYN